jgi:8-oxo-dGTP pyrophosphatase MutT (NUDIX family)
MSPVRSERSAGVIVFRSDPQAAGGRVFLLLDYGRFWDYPKGHVEAGEDDQTAAVRELAEETGIRDAALVEGFRHQIEYFFRDKRKGLIRKTVVFFLAATHRKRITISHEHEGYAFLPYDAACKRLTYPTAKSVLEAAEAFLRSGESSGTLFSGISDKLSEPPGQNG